MKARIFVALATAFLLTGCALTEDKVVVKYQAPANISVTPGAKDVTVEIIAVDGRVSNKDRVSTKKNGYGMEMAKIVAGNDIVAEVAAAVRVELESLGFNIGSGGLKITAETTEFYNDFKIGMFSGDAVAEVAFNLNAKKADGSYIYGKTYKAVGFNKNQMMATGSAAQPALAQALRDAVQQMVRDTDFHQALVKAGTEVKQQAGKPVS